MLKLRYLFDNRDLALMLLENWEYDKDAMDMLNNFRISANAVYPYKLNGETFFLRFVPWNVKNENEMKEEIDFILYLHKEGLNVLEPILSKNGKYLLKKDTPWGEYLVCAFKRVLGEDLENFISNENGYSNELIKDYGKTLGKLHKFSNRYKKVNKKSCFDLLDELEYIYKNDFNGKAEIIISEFNELKKLLNQIPKNEANYGLLHGDFELDNVFFDKNTGNFSIIDFGNSLYHWYVIDIDITLASLKDEISEKDFDNVKTLFLNGYCEEYTYDDKTLEYMPIFKRFEELREYIELKNILEETWDNEPQWMTGLREKLNKYYIKNKYTKLIG